MTQESVSAARGAVLEFLIMAHGRGNLHPVYVLLCASEAAALETVRLFLRTLNIEANDKLDNHPDVARLGVTYDEDGNMQHTAISVDDVRFIKSRFSGHATVQDGYRVVLIERAADLTVQAANALLKLLEEPGKRMVFFLAAKSEHDVLPTIRSRAHALHIPTTGPALDTNSSEALLCERFFHSDEAQQWQLAEELFSKKSNEVDFEALIDTWQLVVRSCWLHAQGVETALHDLPAAHHAIAARAGEHRLRMALESLLRMRAYSRHNVQPRLLFEHFILGTQRV